VLLPDGRGDRGDLPGVGGLGGAMAQPIQGSHPIVGTWRLTSFTEQDLETGTVRYPFGSEAKAFVVYAENGYVATIFTSSDRPPPASAQVTDAEAARLYRSMIAFAGRYEAIGNRLIYRPEISWNEAWNGSVQERTFAIEGDRLETNSLPAVNALTGARTVFSLAWERAR
jgi:hypothetical protein